MATWRTQLKIAAITGPGVECGATRPEAGGCHRGVWRAFGLSNPVEIAEYDATDVRLYSVVIHELAHASHYNMSRWHFKNGEEVVKESWATGVEWELTRMIYTAHTPGYSRLRYTGIVQDLIDGTDTTAISYYYYDDTRPEPSVPSEKNY